MTVAWDERGWRTERASAITSQGGLGSLLLLFCTGCCSRFDREEDVYLKRERPFRYYCTDCYRYLRGVNA